MEEQDAPPFASFSDEGSKSTRRGPERIRDLRGRDRWIVWSIFGTLMLLPLAGALVLHLRGWIPVGDVANISIRSHDVFGADSPMLGQPTTGALADGTPIHQPGPLGYWLLAPFVHLLPWDVGALVGSAVAASTALGLGLLMAWRLGRTVFPVTAIGLAVFALANGTHDLIVPLNPYMAAIWILPAVLAVGAMHRDDLLGLPVYVFATSVAVQSHVLVGTGLGFLAPIVLWTLVRVLADPERRTRAMPILIGSTLLGILIWIPTIAETLRQSNNLGALIQGQGEGWRVGYSWIIERAVTAIGPVPHLLEPSSVAHSVTRSAPATLLVGLLTGSLGSIAVLLRRRGDEHHGRMVTAFFLLLIGFVWSGSRAEFGSQLRSELFLWMRPLGLLFLLTLALGVLILLPPPWRDRLNRQMALPAAVIVAVLGLAVVGGTQLSDRWDGPNIPPMKRALDEMAETVEPGTYLLRTSGSAGMLMAGPAVLNRFHGTDVVLLQTPNAFTRSVTPASRLIEETPGLPVIHVDAQAFSVTFDSDAAASPSEHDRSGTDHGDEAPGRIFASISEPGATIEIHVIEAE